MFTTPLIGAGLLGEDRAIDASAGRRLRAMVSGNGPDLVVLEAGLGLSGLYWSPVVDLLARQTRVVAYERAGFGGSDVDTEERTLSRLADDLESVIDAFPHERLVLVGHSWGGPIVREVAARRLGRGRSIAGVVLVDQSDEHADLYFSRVARWQFTAQAGLMVPLARLRVLGPLLRSQTPGLASPLRAAAVAASGSITAAMAAAAEQRQVVAGLGELRTNPPHLGDIPVRVLSGAVSGALSRRPRAILTRAHRLTADAHAGGLFVPATRSEHMIPLTEPDLVAAQVGEILAAHGLPAR
jgi:pimeloyl-ACP methyl ester carboxylesterase